MDLRHLPDPIRTGTMNSTELRRAFLLEGLFTPGRIDLSLMDLERGLVGSAVPVVEPLALEAPPALDAAFFCQRRELGIFNIGGPGRVATDGHNQVVAPRECLYVGRGTRRVVFESADSAMPAVFYLVSFPAHATYPTTLGRRDSARVLRLGS